MKRLFYIDLLLLTMLLFTSCTITTEQEPFVSDKVVGTTKTKPNAGLTAKEIMTVVKSKENLSLLRKCNENVLILVPYFSSKFPVQFKITANGPTILGIEYLGVEPVTRRSTSII